MITAHGAYRCDDQAVGRFGSRCHSGCFVGLDQFEVIQETQRVLDVTDVHVHGVQMHFELEAV